MTVCHEHTYQYTLENMFANNQAYADRWHIVEQEHHMLYRHWHLMTQCSCLPHRMHRSYLLELVQTCLLHSLDIRN